MLKLSHCALAGFLCVTSLTYSAIAAESATTDRYISAVPIADPALAACIRAYSTEQGYKTVSEVREVPCFNKGIRSLSGLEAFTEALVIDVSLNEISDFSPLYGLGARLGYLDIHGNHVACSLLQTLPRLLPRAAIVGVDPRECEAQPTPGTPSQPSQPAPGTPTQPTQPTPGTPTPSQPQPMPTPPAPTPAVDYAPVAAAVSRNCGECHTNGGRKGHVQLDSELDLVDEAANVLAAIEDGRMPPGERGFAASTDGKILIAYLQAKLPNLPGGNPGRNCRRGGREGDDDDFASAGLTDHGRHRGERDRCGGDDD